MCRFIPLLLLCGCATSFQPKIGTTLVEWQAQCRAANWTSGQLVGAKDNYEAHICDNRNIVHIFEDGRLVEVEQVSAQTHTGNEGAALIGAGVGLMQSARPSGIVPFTCTQMGNFVNCF